MTFSKEMILTDSIEIEATPEKIFDFFVRIDENYKAWHPDDHVEFRWIKGKPLEEGAIGYFEEYLHGKLHKAKVLYTKIVPNREIEYSPLFWLWRIFWPKGTFTIEPKGESCIFTATVCYRLGWLSTKLAKNRIKGPQIHHNICDLLSPPLDQNPRF